MQLIKSLLLIKTLLLFVIISCQAPHVATDKTSSDSEEDSRRFNPYALVFNSGDPYREKFANTERDIPKIQVMLDEEIPKNYYQIMRCHESVKVHDQYANDPLQMDYPTYKTVSAHLYAWGKANVDGCIFLSGMHRQSVFEDITAPSGKFFYLLRPCLNPNRSQFGKLRTCHYLYRKTGSIDYTDTFTQDQWKLRLELAAMRNSLQSHFSQLSELIIRKAHFLERCESEQARKCMFKARFAGIGKLVLTAAATTTGAILSGGTAAFQAGAATIKFADKVFSSASNCSLQCDTSIFDKRIVELEEGITPIAEAIDAKLAALQK